MSKCTTLQATLSRGTPPGVGQPKMQRWVPVQTRNILPYSCGQKFGHTLEIDFCFLNALWKPSQTHNTIEKPANGRQGWYFKWVSRAWRYHHHHRRHHCQGIFGRNRSYHPAEINVSSCCPILHWVSHLTIWMVIWMAKWISCRLSYWKKTAMCQSLSTNRIWYHYCFRCRYCRYWWYHRWRRKRPCKTA